MSRNLNYSYQELVGKAQYLFWVNGYKSVSPEKLAKHLDVSISTIRNKYTKEMLFMDSLNSYIVDLSDPFLQKLREAKKGVESLRKFYYMVVDALVDKTFPRSCFMVNTVMEMRNEEQMITDVYDRYFGNMKDSYKTVLHRAIAMKEISKTNLIEEYADLLVGVIFSLSILYRVKTRKELYQFIDEQLSLLV